MAADGVNFINENDARRILLALLEKVTYAARADAYEHFHEVRARDREEWNVRFARNRARQKGLASARRTNQQNALRDASAKFLEFLRVFQEFNDLLQLFLRFVGSRNIFESGFLLLSGKQTRAGFAEAQSLVSTGLHLAHEEQTES